MAPSHRQQFLYSCQETAAEQGETTRLVILKCIQAAETKRYIYQHILGINATHAAVDSLKSTQDGLPLVVSNPSKIEILLLSRNIEHFAQTHGLPFTRPPLSDTYNFEASKA